MNCFKSNEKAVLVECMTQNGDYWIYDNSALPPPAEIHAGHRIDNDMGDDSRIENHVSPNCKVEVK